MDLGVRAVLGTFDGVHIGHRALFSRAKEMSRADGMSILAFVILRSGEHLCSREERQERLIRAGADDIVFFDLDEIRELDCEQFVRLLGVYGVRSCVCGENFRFGRGREGDADRLHAFIPCEVVPTVCLEGEPVSSTRIRDALCRGDVAACGRMLGTPYALSGEVRHGRAIGRDMGFPTANISIPDYAATPRDGVYITRVRVGRRAYPALANVGARPTVGGHERRLECYLDGFCGDLYGRDLRVEFIDFLRDQMRFESIDALSRRIESDVDILRERIRG